MTRLNKAEIEERMPEIPGWRVQDSSLRKVYEFKDFSGSVNFIKQIEPHANSANHHPDLCINYNRVEVTLSTHDEGGITDKDFKMAKKIDEIYSSLK